MSDSPPASSSTLSEAASKELVRAFGVPIARERRAADPDAAVAAARELGGAVVCKLNGDAIAHKTERDLVRLHLSGDEAVRAAAEELLGKARPEDGAVDLLVAEMVAGRRELIAGLVRDPQFGPCVVLGLGGILTEALEDVVFAAAPLAREEAKRLVERLQASHLLTKPFRGAAAVDLDALADVLVGLSELAAARPDVRSVDLNPLIVTAAGLPVAVDALVELGEADSVEVPPARDDVEIRERFAPLFHPRGVVVAGASSHPGKFGFVTLHNLRRFGYAGEIFPVKPDGAEVLGRPTYTDVSE
ncbi:MAG: acetate--CoA ligase family protein, partial [Proteobacteria bacterium]|nr:acetate--CoA ligase family protein [Pseudomonadota bacterium]